MSEPISVAPLYGNVIFVDRMMGGDYPNPEIVHLCRDDDGNIIMLVDSSMAVMKAEDVKWLIGNLAAALDNWTELG